MTCDDDDDDDDVLFFSPPFFNLSGFSGFATFTTTQPLLETCARKFSTSALHPKVRSPFEQQKVLKAQCVTSVGLLA